MKIRNGFVSNSSSSSFCIKKDKIDEKQIDLIKNHIKSCNSGVVDCPCGYHSDEDPYWHPGDCWEIRENEKEISGFTIMDNFDMFVFLEKIGIKKEDVDVREY